MAQLAPRDKQNMVDVQRQIDDLFGRIMRDMQEVEIEAARRDPEGHKRTHLMGGDGSPRYRYYNGGRDKRGITVRFCYSVNPNVAGRFLVWRETIKKRGGVRDDFSYVKSKKTAKAVALRRWRAHQAANGSR